MIETATARYEREAAFHDRAFAEASRARVRRFYDVARDAYDAYAGLVAGPPGRAVLEYGCGPGSQAFSLAENGDRVQGIDLSPVAIEMARDEAARRGVADRAAFSVMNAESLEHDDAAFDLVCGSSILHHLELERGYAEVARVLRPGGRAVFLEPLGHNPAINLYRRLTPSLRTPDEHPLTVADIERAHEWFVDVRLRFFCITALLAAPLAGRPRQRPLLQGLRAFDQALLRHVAPLRSWAWIVVIDLAHPKPQLRTRGQG